MKFSRDDILGALGIENNQNWMTFALAGFGVGCLVGAGLALAFAPKSGRELRSDIYERGREMLGKGQEYAREMRESIQQNIPPTTPSY